MTTTEIASGSNQKEEREKEGEFIRELLRFQASAAEEEALQGKETPHETLQFSNTVGHHSLFDTAPSDKKKPWRCSLSTQGSVHTSTNCESMQLCMNRSLLTCKHCPCCSVLSSSFLWTKFAS